MEDFYKFDCGCKWPILEPSKNGKIPKLKINLHNLPYCDLAWKIFSNGDTKGIFQLESHLGKQWSKKLKPKNMEHLSALGALLRPGCLRALDEDGISMTEHYCKRVNGLEKVPSYHESVDEILKPTYGALVFQEQAMQIAQAVAGFNLQEADVLRKAIGKKNTQEMANCKKMFIDGAKKAKIISDEQAEELFGWIQASQRYSFNKCLSPDSVVETKEGFKTLKELNINDYVLAPSIKYKKNIFIKVKDKINNGKQEVYEITTSSGKKLKCTLNHKILCSDGKKRTLYDILEKNYSIMCDLE